MIIDVHAHCLPSTASTGGIPTASMPSLEAMQMSDSPEHIAARVRKMDEAGIDMQILMSGPSNYDDDPLVAVAATRALNEALAKVVDAHPTRFAAYLALPLPHIQASLDELARWAGDRRFVGIAGHCSVLGRSMGDEHFEPLFEALDKQGAVIFLHPVVNGICSAFVNDWGLAASVGTSLEDAIAVLHLVIRKVPHRFPKLKFIIPHLGGPLPMLLPRLDGQLPWAHPDLPEKPSATVRRFFYDTVGHGSHPAVRCACEAFGASQLLTGSDFPFLPKEGYADTIDYIRASGIADDQVERIVGRNASELFALPPRR